MSAQPNEELKPGQFYFDGITYIFQHEADGNARMICEVRGEGDRKFEENAKLIVDSLNRRSQEAPQGERVAKLRVALLAIANERKNDEGIQRVIWKALDADKAEADREGKA